LEITKEIDAAALAAYCEIWSLFRTACESVRADGLTVTNTGKDGAEQHAPNPTVGVMLKAAAQLRAWCGEFGLTPSSEMRITKPEVPNAGQAENPFG
jgi:P27 family predicted phage terminase small subunit